jgi:hypothetical protein
MRIRGWIALTCLAAIASMGCNGDSATGPTRGSSATTYLDVHSDPGDYIGAGESHRYTLEDSVWTARADLGVMEPRHITISLRPIDNSFRWWWNLDLAAPTGQPLKPGTYDNARRWPFQSASQPGLSFSGTGRGCNTLTGSFVIRVIELGPDNTLDRFSASFEQHCEGSSAALRGDINVVANPWR